jgi:catechol 2,3-dioxygenase-like lactoylglutathione lyase family enzyme
MIRGGWVRLSVAELDRAVRFYVETLGMKLVSEAEESATIDCGDGFRIELAKAPPGEHRGAVAVGLRPKMPLAEAIAILENRGVTFDATHGFHDPDGNVLYLALDE